MRFLPAKRNDDFIPLYIPIPTALKAIQKNLSEDLLKKEFKTEGLEKNHPFYGHCYVASEALWHLTNQHLTIHRAKDDHNITHWWLQNGSEKVDPTQSQYTDFGIDPPYNHGKRAHFLTGKTISQRSKTLLLRMTS